MKRENLKYIIKESLKRIYEEQHISQTVKEWADSVYFYILEHYQKIKFIPHTFSYQTFEKERHGIEYRVGTFYFEKEPFTEIKVTIFDFNCLADIEIFLRHEELESKFYNENNKISLLLVSVNGKLLEKYSKKIISHEIRHAFDYLNTGIDNRKLYYSAVSTMKKLNNARNDVNYLVASLIYWFTDEEINANCQGLYGELENSGINTFANIKDNTNVYSEFLYLENIYNYLFCTFNNEISWYERSFFLNTSLGKIGSYLRKQITYAKKRFDKVAYRYLKEKKYVNENFRFGTPPFLKPIIV